MRKTTLFALLLAGCGAQPPPNSDTLAGFTYPAAPPNGIQIVLPIVRNLQPGSDNEICTWTDTIVDVDTDVKGLQAFQAPMGHHVVLFSTKVFQPAGTNRPCTDDDMSTFRFSVGAGGEGQAGLNEAPGDLTYRIPAKSQVVINHHYINATNQVHDSQSVVNIFYADPALKLTPVSSLAFVNTNFKLPPTGMSSLDINCTMQRDVNAYQLFPHMHQYGSHIVFEKTSPAGKTDRMFDIPWSPDYQFHPPQMMTDPSKPFVFAKGDLVHIHCDWVNPTGKPLTFGLEMCVGFAAAIDSDNQGNIACDDGAWGPF